MAVKRPIYLSDEYRNSLGRLLDLTDKQKQALKKRLKREIKEWLDDTEELHRKLKRWNDLVEGVVEETDYPFVGASNIHVPIIGIYCKVYHSIERRSILGSDMIWYMETLDETLREMLPNIEEAVNYKARCEWNIGQALSDVFWTTNRDGLGVMEISYVEEYETNQKDSVLIASIMDFMDEFPTPEDLGTTPEEWYIMQQYVMMEASEENPIEIPVVYDKEVYRGPYGEVVELADFAIFPASAKSIGIQHARGYGKRHYMRKGMIKKKAQEGIWYEDAVKSLLQKAKDGSDVSDYRKSREEIEGISRSGKSDDHEFFNLVYRFELEKDKGEAKILVEYNYEHDELMAAIEFPYRVDHYALFRIESKPNRLIGNSVPKELEDMNEEVDALHNQRVNARKIVEVPSFKGKKSRKGDYDTATADNVWHPGVIFWLDDPEAFEQFKIQPVDLRSSLQEEDNDMRISSLAMGVEPFLFSGAPTSDNPDAPGNKTAILIQQSNLRMEDPIAELREGVEKVGEICLSHEYQFGDPLIVYAEQNPAGQQTTRTIPKRLLRKGIKVRMSGVTVALNPEAEFQKWMAYYAALTPDPIIGGRPQSRWYLLMNALRSGRVNGREKILPTLEELAMEQQAMMAQALVQGAQMKADAEQAGKDQAMKDQVARNGTQDKLKEQVKSKLKQRLGAGS